MKSTTLLISTAIVSLGFNGIISGQAAMPPWMSREIYLHFHTD